MFCSPGWCFCPNEFDVTILTENGNTQFKYSAAHAGLRSQHPQMLVVGHQVFHLRVRKVQSNGLGWSVQSHVAHLDQRQDDVCDGARAQHAYSANRLSNEQVAKVRANRQTILVTKPSLPNGTDRCHHAAGKLLGFTSLHGHVEFLFLRHLPQFGVQQI